MTAVCGGGTSEAKPGFNQTVIVTGAIVEGSLVISGLEAIAALISPFLAGTVYDLTTFCNVDPPADPGLTTQDLLDLTNWRDPSRSIPALGKLRTWFESWYWYDVCRCTSTPQPTAPTPSNPGNVVSTNPGLPVSSSPCWNVTRQFVTVASPNNTTTENADLSTLMLPNLAPSLPNGTFSPGTPLAVTLYTIPTGARDITFTISSVPDITNSSTFAEAFLYFFDSTGLLLHVANSQISETLLEPQLITGGTHPNTAHWPGSVPTNAVYWAVQFSSQNTVSTTITLTLQFSCAAGASLDTQPCCPPDPSIDTRLQQIYGLLQSIYQGLPTPVHSYADGTAHAGLSGNGTVTLVGAPLAIRVNITTDSPALGLGAGNPTYLFDRGFIVPVVNNAPIRGESRLVYNPQMFPLPALTEQIGYSLHPGIVATVTELVAGP